MSTFGSMLQKRKFVRFRLKFHNVSLKQEVQVRKKCNITP